MSIMEAQGLQIRRASTTEVTTLSSVLSFSASQVLSSDTAVVDFVSDGYTTGMVLLTNSTNNTSVFNIDTVASSAITLHQTATAQAADAISITGQTMQALGSITSLGGPARSNADIDTTDLSSTAKTSLPGVIASGPVTLEAFLNFDTTARQAELRLDQTSRGIRSFDIRYTDQTTVSGAQPSFEYFNAWVGAFSPSGAVDGAVTLSMTLNVTSSIRNVDRT